MHENKNILAHQLTDIQNLLNTNPGEINFQSPGMSVLINNADKRIIFCDEKFTEKSGYNNADIIQPGFTFLSLLADTQLERFDMQLQNVLAGRTANLYNAYDISNKSGERNVYYLYMYKVGSQNLAEGLMQLYMMPEMSGYKVPFISFDTRELFLQQFGSVGFGTFEWMIDSNKIYWSEGLYAIYDMERTSKQFDRSYLRSFTHPDDMDRSARIVTEALRTGKGYDDEFRIITATGRMKIIRAVGKVITDSTGKPVKLAGSIRDVTEQRAVEQDLKKSVTELHRSNSELEEFAYVASHDLQEPLRKITTFCGRLADKYGTSLSDEGTMYVERIIASAENMRLLIHNLLEFSRVSKNIEPASPVSLAFVLHQVKHDLELLIEETGTVIEVDLQATVYTSVVQMKQLFTNLLNNAIKFRKEDIAPHIKISSHKLLEHDKEKHFIHSTAVYEEIIVEDNGIGLDNEYAERIFQIFQRLHGKSEYPGSGIGLAICRKIVEKYKGVIFADGETGVGTRFHIILPVSDPEV
jgi:signal transduction histidine kinase